MKCSFIYLFIYGTHPPWSTCIFKRTSVWFLSCHPMGSRFRTKVISSVHSISVYWAISPFLKIFLFHYYFFVMYTILVNAFLFYQQLQLLFLSFFTIIIKSAICLILFYWIWWICLFLFWSYFTYFITVLHCYRIFV